MWAMGIPAEYRFVREEKRGQNHEVWCEMGE